MAYCPACISFGIECHPDPEEYWEPCPYFIDKYREWEKEAVDQPGEPAEEE